MTTSSREGVLQRLVLVALMMCLAGCAKASDAASNNPSNPGTDAQPDSAALERLFAQPGPTVASFPAGAALPGIHDWSAHVAPDGVSVRSEPTAGEAAVALVLSWPTPGKDGVSVVVRKAASLTVSYDDVVKALAADFASLTPSAAADLHQRIAAAANGTRVNAQAVRPQDVAPPSNGTQLVGTSSGEPLVAPVPPIIKDCSNASERPSPTATEYLKAVAWGFLGHQSFYVGYCGQ